MLLTTNLANMMFKRPNSFREWRRRLYMVACKLLSNLAMNFLGYDCLKLQMHGDGWSSWWAVAAAWGCRWCIWHVPAKWWKVSTKFYEDWSSGSSVMVAFVCRLSLELLMKQLTRGWRRLWVALSLWNHYFHILHEKRIRMICWNIYFICYQRKLRSEKKLLSSYQFS